MKKILVIVGTRPNFIKITQFKKVAEKYSGIELKIVHTGQHYDKNMTDVFFDQFNLRPNYFLGVSAASSNKQIAEMMSRLEDLIKERFYPDLIIVPGDVNSSLAGALVANSLKIELAHLESGLRSFDREMPEEINRILIDEIAQHFFVTEESGVENIKKECKTGTIHFVGNTMIDTLVHFEDKIEASDVLENEGIKHRKFVLVTIHRPSNVDQKKDLLKLLELFRELNKRYLIVFPIHPRTVIKLNEFDLQEEFDSIKNLKLLSPQGYFEFQKLVRYSSFILTDSGGIQEESTFRKVPCLTLRENTERPITTEIGTNTLVSFNIEEILPYVEKIEKGSYKTGKVPEKWDGDSTERIFKVLDGL